MQRRPLPKGVAKENEVTTEEEHTETTEEHEEDGSDLVKRLRQQLKDKDKVIEAYQPLAKEKALQLAGVKAESPEGKMLTRIFDREGREWTKEAVVEAADEFGIGLGGEDDGSEESQITTGPRPGTDTSQDSARARDAANADGLIDGAGQSPDWQTEREQDLQRIDETLEEGSEAALLQHIALQRKVAGLKSD